MRPGFIEFSVLLTRSGLLVEMPILLPPILPLTKQWQPFRVARKTRSNLRANRLMRVTSYDVWVTMAISGAGYFIQEHRVSKRLKEVKRLAGHACITQAKRNQKMLLLYQHLHLFYVLPNSFRNSSDSVSILIISF
jgi:hypothetical protein